MSHRITLIPGDGVGPEIALATRRVIDAAGVAIEWEEAEAGAEVFKRGDSTGVPRETADSIARTRVALKGPLETPVGFGEKSANVTLRKLFETYANIRPARQIPGVPTRYDGEGIDFIVVRENIEDLYAGVEYLDSRDVAVALKIISRRGSEKIIRYAFELARREGRRKVTCATKANILKLSEGMFKRIFEEMAPEYPEIEAQHLIIDNVAHQMAKDPAQFDVIVTTNLAGDIISDLASGLVGGLGFAASGNYGDTAAIFEAVHGSAPKYAGKNVINPTALILSSVMMLRHIGEPAAAQRIEDAVFVTLEEGEAVTLDVARQAGDVEHATSTSGFADAIIANLGRAPSTRYPTKSQGAPATPPEPRPRWEVRSVDRLGHPPRGRGRLHRAGRRGGRGGSGPGGRRRPRLPPRCSSRRAARWSTRPATPTSTRSAGGAAASWRRRRAAAWTTRPSSACWPGSGSACPGSTSRSCACTATRRATPAPRDSRRPGREWRLDSGRGCR